MIAIPVISPVWRGLFERNFIISGSEAEIGMIDIIIRLIFRFSVNAVKAIKIRKIAKKHKNIR